MATKRNDPRVLLAGAMSSAAEVIGAVTEDQLDLPTPCSDFDVRTLAKHLMSPPPTVASLGRGDEYGAVAEGAVPFDSGARTGPRRRPRPVPRGPTTHCSARSSRCRGPRFPAGAVLAQFTGEIVVHTWDLATATGQWGEWQPEVLDLAFESYKQGLPAEGREQFPVFKAVVPVADDAPLIDQIVAWTGRQP